jgi:hypothetical protein
MRRSSPNAPQRVAQRHVGGDEHAGVNAAKISMPKLQLSRAVATRER